MVARSFVDPETLQYWRSSCQTDPESAGCQYFLKRYTDDVRELNPYSNYYILLKTFTDIVIIMIPQVVKDKKEDSNLNTVFYKKLNNNSTKKLLKLVQLKTSMS